MTDTRKAHLAIISATIIFGFHYNVVKGMMPVMVSPMQLIFLRLSSGALIFWLFQRIFVPEKVSRKDLFMLALCGLLGFTLNQTFFYAGINLTTPVDASLIHVLNPVFVMIFAAILIGEKITWRKASGIALGAAGVLILVLYGRKVSFDGNHGTGNILIFLNLIFYALYLVLLKPMVARYHTATVLKWVSFFGFIFVVPFSIKPMMDFQPGAITITGWLGIAYIIILNTFVAYLLINFALKYVNATVVSYYSYVQPVIATSISVMAGQGGITIPKIVAALLIFTGVYVVNRPGKKNFVSTGA